MQYGAPPHYTNSIKKILLMGNFGWDRLVNRVCKIAGSGRSPDLILLNFWLWIYLKWLVYHSSSSAFSILKDSICQEVSAIHSHMLHSAITGVLSCINCIIECSGAHIKYFFFIVKINEGTVLFSCSLCFGSSEPSIQVIFYN